MLVPEKAVEIIAGFHVPVMAGMLFEFKRSSGAKLFWQIGLNCVKVGTDCLITVIVTVFDKTVEGLTHNSLLVIIKLTLSPSSGT